MLAPDGRCKTFDAFANGYVRGEGYGILVMKRLSEVEADGDRIWGIIRGTAINQDGASDGLTVPNQEAQELVIQEALSRAGVSPSQVGYVKAHGTGTPVGDPIELEAMGAVYSIGRDAQRPLLIGLGEDERRPSGIGGRRCRWDESAAGHESRRDSKASQFQYAYSAVGWERMPLSVTAEATDWPTASNRAPLAGVSGFGWSGTNAHVVVEGYRPVKAEGASNGLSREWSPAGSRRRIDASTVATQSVRPLPTPVRKLPGDLKSSPI